MNPTSCKRTSTASTLLGSGLDFASEADDRPVTVSTPFQAADCAALPFKPRLSLKLKGGTRRGSYPALTATLNMNGIGEAGIKRAEVVLPSSEFIANAHFKTICTRVVFKQGTHPGEKCPAGSIYGYAKAITPVLSEPLEGPVFLRSSEHQLPDVVASLHNGEIDVTLDGKVDSVKGRLRNTFEATPDAPVSSVVISLQGGKKGLFENSTNLCDGTHKAEANFTGQNGKELGLKPELVKPLGCKGPARPRSTSAGANAMRRRAGALATLVALLCFGTLAQATVVQEGNVRITVLSQILPYKLPRHGVAPIAVFVSGHLSEPHGGIPPQLQEMTVEVNKHGLLQSKGLPTCPLRKIQPASTERALSSCGDALIGSGQFWAHIVLPDQGAYPTHGRLLIFNGTPEGQGR